MAKKLLAASLVAALFVGGFLFGSAAKRKKHEQAVDREIIQMEKELDSTRTKFLAGKKVDWDAAQKKWSRQIEKMKKRYPRVDVDELTAEFQEDAEKTAAAAESKLVFVGEPKKKVIEMEIEKEKIIDWPNWYASDVELDDGLDICAAEFIKYLEFVLENAKSVKLQDFADNIEWYNKTKKETNEKELTNLFKGETLEVEDKPFTISSLQDLENIIVLAGKAMEKTSFKEEEKTEKMEEPLVEVISTEEEEEEEPEPQEEGVPVKEVTLKTKEQEELGKELEGYVEGAKTEKVEKPELTEEIILKD